MKIFVIFQDSYDQIKKLLFRNRSPRQFELKIISGLVGNPKIGGTRFQDIELVSRKLIFHQGLFTDVLSDFGTWSGRDL